MTAAKWWGAGCRTLDDVRARPDLNELQQVGGWEGRGGGWSEQWQWGAAGRRCCIGEQGQVLAPLPHLIPFSTAPPCALHFSRLSQVGLRYFDDLQRKIPRAEVAQIEAVAREACLALVGAWAARLSMPRNPHGCLPA